MYVLLRLLGKLNLSDFFIWHFLTFRKGNWVVFLVLKVGADSGRHGWFKWSRGPVPEGDKTTQAVNIFDLLLLSVKSVAGTDEFEWRESRPCSEKVTRVLGIICSVQICRLVTTFSTNSCTYCGGKTFQPDWACPVASREGRIHENWLIFIG